MEQSQESVSQRIVRLNNLLNQTVTQGKIDNGSSLISRESLLDALILLYDECNNEFLMKDPLIAGFVEKYRSTVLQLRDLVININDFETRKIISRGRFAEVSVVKERNTEVIGVLKKIRKSDIINVHEGLYFENERNLLIAASNDNESRKWVPRLFYSFQNMKFIYYLMEYCPGGNLCTMLEYYKRNVPEPMLRFYLAEMIQAVRCIHQIGFVHRDIKPENILIDVSGHLKLIDFGSSAKILKNGLVNTKMILNIPHYTAPEIFKFHDVSTMKGYGAQCDWWSLGIVLFEMITGSVPFTSDEIPKLYLSSNYSRKLQYPKQISVSQELKNIISGMLQPVDKRLTYEKLCELDYFNDIDWECLRERDPPFVPSLTAADDTSYFTTFDIQRPTPKVEDFKLQRRFTGRNLPFLGFTYLWSEPVSPSYEVNSVCRALFMSKSSVAAEDRRKTDHFDQEMQDCRYLEVQRHSTGTTCKSEMTSECSNDSYQSAASVRLENEVNQLHLFYNEKALIIEEKLKTKFHDMYNCLTDDQRKYLVEKEQLMNQLKENEEIFAQEKEVLLNKNKELENELVILKEKTKEITNSMEELKRDCEEQINKFKKTEKLKKDAMTKLNLDLQKVHKELEEKSQKLKDSEEKLLSLSNQQAAKLAMLNKARTNLRSKSVERDKYEQENVVLKNQLNEANKKISKLTAELERKGKMKFDLEVKMMTTDKDGVERNFKASENKENSNVNELKEQLKQKETEIALLLRESNQRKDELEVKCKEFNESLKRQELDYSRLKLDYDVLFKSNMKTVLRLEEVEKKLTEYEKHNNLINAKRETISRKSIIEVNVKENEIKQLKQDLVEEQDASKIKENEIRRLKDELQRAESNLRSVCQEKTIILNEKLNEIRGKNEEIKMLNKEISTTKDKHQKSMEEEIKKLKKVIQDKDNQLADLNEQIAKMNEDMFASLVSIEELKTTISEKSSIITICENEISYLKRELQDKSQQVTNIRTSLNASDKEKKKLETKIESLLNEVKQSNTIKLKEIEASKVNSKELLKQFESTVRELLKENLDNKENVKTTTDFETMLSTVQRKLSILSERPVLVENVVQKSNVESQPVTVLEAQIERLESQLEKSRENAVLQREAAAQAKKELAVAEKELADLKIDLRIAQREAKTAEEEVKKLQKARFVYYKELKEEKENLETQLNETQEKVTQYETELADLKQILKKKDHDIQTKDSSIESYLCEIKSLKTENKELQSVKMKTELESNKRVAMIENLKSEVEHLKKEVSCLKEKEKEWKTKYVNLEKQYSVVKEACEANDDLADALEKNVQCLGKKIKTLEEEKYDLQNEVDRVNEELKITRKLINEEKSLKVFTENKVRLLETDIAKKGEEVKLLEEDLMVKTEYVQGLEDKIKQLEEYINTANDSMLKGSQYTELMKKEIVFLKQERSELLTSLHRLKEENGSLRNELREATDDLNDLQEANGELQSALAQFKTYYETRHWKDNETLQQHYKLIEFLQNKFQDASKHKRTLADKLFRSKGRENLNPKEFERLLYLERNKSKGLADQLYQARIELEMLRGENVSKSTSPKLISDFESCLSRSTLTKNPLTSVSNFSEFDGPVIARLKHNIPHKFYTKTCKKIGCKCAFCNQPISSGHKMSKCKECHHWFHVSCTVKIGPTCGLSQAMLEQISTLNKYPVQSSLSSIESSLKSEIEGNIRVLRDKTWERMIVKIHDKRLSLYDKSNIHKEPKEKISFDSIISVDVDIEMAESVLENLSDGESRCVLKILYQTDDKQEQTLYMLAATEEDKINWMNILKRNFTGSQKQITFKLDREECFKGNVICEFEKPNMRVNQVIQLSPQLCILAADEGLFSLKLKENSGVDKSYSPVNISGVGKVTRIKVLTKLRVALLICEENDSLKKCDLRMLVSNAEAAECSSPCIAINEVSNSILSLKNCRLLEASSCNTLLAVATASYLILLRWRDGGFDEMKYKRKISDVKCMLFTQRRLLFSTPNELYGIDLDTFDENKLNLFKCVNDMNAKLCEPEAIIKISTDLYLICDKLFGVFVNADGKRIKSAETMKWPLPLYKIVYNKPFLCLTHDSCVSLIYLPSSAENSEEKFKFSMIDFCNPSILGIVKDPIRGIFFKEETQNTCKLYFLDPIVFMKRNPKQSWSSISTHSGGETTDEECIGKSLDISVGTDISLNSSLLESYEQ